MRNSCISSVIFAFCPCLSRSINLYLARKFMMSEVSGSEREALSAISSMLCHAFLSFNNSRSKSNVSNVCLLHCGNGDVGLVIWKINGL